MFILKVGKKDVGLCYFKGKQQVSSHILIFKSNIFPNSMTNDGTKHDSHYIMFALNILKIYKVPFLNRITVSTAVVGSESKSLFRPSKTSQFVRQL